MTVKELVEKMDLKVLTKDCPMDQTIETGYIGDLLSVVMGKAKANCAWITIQSHINIIAVATLVDMACIIVTEGFKVEEDAIKKAAEEGIPILSSKDSSYEVARKMVELGI